MRQYNVETEKQTTLFGDYNKQRAILNQQLQQQKAQQEAVLKGLQDELAQTYVLGDAFNKTRTQRIQLEKDLANTDKLDIQRRIELNARINAVKETERQLGEQLKSTNANFIDQSQKLAEVETALSETEKALKKIDSG